MDEPRSFPSCTSQALHAPTVVYVQLIGSLIGYAS